MDEAESQKNPEDNKELKVEISPPLASKNNSFLNKKYHRKEEIVKKGEKEIIGMKKGKGEPSITNQRAVNDKCYCQQYSFAAKGDKSKVILRFNIPSSYLKYEKSLTLKEKYTSPRNDLWTFYFDHTLQGKGSGGKIKMKAKVEKKEKNGYALKVFNCNELVERLKGKIIFNLDIVCNSLIGRPTNHSINDIVYGKDSSTIEIIIGDGAYTTSGPQKGEIVFLLEITVSKRFAGMPNLGLNGIINEGATCYINSMLQTLNSISMFKKAIFQIPTQNDSYANSVTLCLQKLFYDLMTNKGYSASTKFLLNSFGWSKEQIQIQHDILEFNLKLNEVIQNKVNTTEFKEKDIFKFLFQGKIKNYIKCTEVDFESALEENYSDIQLTVKNYENIYKSLDAYTEGEILDNENKYETEKYGKQKAIKRIQFLSFPPVLILQLKRFEYIEKKESMVKINDFFEFYDELDLNKYVEHTKTDKKKEEEKVIISPNHLKENKGKNDNIYCLHSVIVHQGNATNGHYYSFINMSTGKYQNEWFQFNDEIVKPADYYEIFSQNFGGIYETCKHKGKGEIQSVKLNFEKCAYVLIYIKKSMRNELLFQFDINKNIPPLLRSRFETEKNYEEDKIKKSKRNSENLTILLITNQNCLLRKNKLGIVNSILNFNLDKPMVFNLDERVLINLPKELKFGEFLNFISKSANNPVENLILYSYNTCTSNSILEREDFTLELITGDNLKMSFEDYREEHCKFFISFFLYVNSNIPLLTEISKNKEIKEEIIVEENDHFYIPKHLNKYTLNFFEEGFNKKIKKEESKHENHKKNISDPNNMVIIFIKEFDINSQGLVLTKVFHINKSNNSPLYEQLLNEVGELNIQKFFMEKTTIPKDLPEELKYEKFLTKDNADVIFSLTNKIILVPVNDQDKTDELLGYMSDLYFSIYVNIYSYPETLIVPKLKIPVTTELTEKYLKDQVILYLKENNAFDIIFDCNNHYFINEKQEMSLINQEFLGDNINDTNLRFIDENPPNITKFEEVKDFNVLGRLNHSECRFNFKFNLYNQLDSNDNFQEFHLYDLYNNEICQLSCLIPKKLRRTFEILDYLYEIIKKKIGCELDRDNYYIIMQSNSKKYAYHLILEDKFDLKMYENKASDIEYRIQPYSNEEINNFKDKDCKRIFFNFSDILFNPIILYFHNDVTFFEIRQKIDKILEKTKGFDEFISKKNDKELKYNFYKCCIHEKDIAKLVNGFIRSEDTVLDCFKDISGALNVLIEFC
ncbi:MAG: hypothetical protein MJ252_08345 [archaeon]|nr:hypothetical protein [archaeon]